jgi:hypothetical protein
MYLNSYHDVQVSPLGVWRILRHLDMGQLPVSQRYPTPPSTDGSATRSRCPGTGYRSPSVHSSGCRRPSIASRRTLVNSTRISTQWW